MQGKLDKTAGNQHFIVELPNYSISGATLVDYFFFGSIFTMANGRCHQNSTWQAPVANRDEQMEPAHKGGWLTPRRYERPLEAMYALGE